MRKRETKSKNQNKPSDIKAKETDISYRLKCTKTANGLSHFVMYGDVPKEKTLL